MKSSSAAFSVYNTVKQIFLKFSHDKYYKGHIDSDNLQPALSAALNKEITQEEVDQALTSFQDQEREDMKHDADKRLKHHSEDGDASTICSQGQHKIRMPEFLVLMQHLETGRVTKPTEKENQNQAQDMIVIDGSSNHMNVSRNDQDPTCNSMALDRATNFLYPHRKILCIQDKGEDAKLSSTAPSHHDQDFKSAFPPTQMRYLALVSHNGMKSTMKRFVLTNKNIIKKFCLTGTNSTMTMLREVIGNDPEVVYGPSCSSGPLGGDAELAALMTQGRMGGMIFFQDPMSAHPHQADIDGLNRLALVHNTMIVNNPTSAVMMMDVLRSALKGQGRPELIPSFFFSMESPSVASYQAAQKQMIMQSIADEASSVGGSTTMVSVKEEEEEEPVLKRNQAGTRPRTTGALLQRNKIASARPAHSRPLSATVAESQKKKKASTRQLPMDHIDIVISPSTSDTSGSTDVSSRVKGGRRVSIKEDDDLQKNPTPNTKRRSRIRRSVSSVMTSKTIDTSAHTASTEGTDLSNNMEDDNDHPGKKGTEPLPIISMRKMNLSMSRRMNTKRNKMAVSKESSRPRWRI